MATNAADIFKRAFANFETVAKRDPKAAGAVEIDLGKVATEVAKVAIGHGPDGDVESLEKAVDEIETFLSKAEYDPVTDSVLSPDSEIAKRFAIDKAEESPAPAAPTPVAPPVAKADAPAAPAPVAPVAAPAPVAKDAASPKAPEPQKDPKKKVAKKAPEESWALDMAAELADIKKARKGAKPAADDAYGNQDDTTEAELAEDVVADKKKAKKAADSKDDGDNASDTDTAADDEFEGKKKAKAKKADANDDDPKGQDEDEERETAKSEDVSKSDDEVVWENDLSPSPEEAEKRSGARKRAAVRKGVLGTALSPDQIAMDNARAGKSAEERRKERVKTLKNKGYQPGMGYQPGLVDGIKD